MKSKHFVFTIAGMIIGVLIKVLSETIINEDDMLIKMLWMFANILLFLATFFLLHCASLRDIELNKTEEEPEYFRKDDEDSY